MGENLPPDGTFSIDLLRRARQGEREALDLLLQRYLPRLRGWATGRLPRWARNCVDTDDLVQDTLMNTLRHLDTFEPRGEGALQFYLRQALRNRIADEVRKVGRRPKQVADVPETQQALDPSPLEQAIGHEALAAYDRALDALQDHEREAVIARVELGQSYEEIARTTGKPTPDAARMAVSRALLRLAREMGHERAT